MPPATPPSCAALEQKYSALLEERLTWRSLVSYVGNRNEPVLRWFRYKESFSAELVRRLISEFGLNEKDFILDPFSGLGTTLYTAQGEGIPSAGVDLLPLSSFVANTLTRVRTLDLDDVSRNYKILIENVGKEKLNGERLPDVPIISRAFTEEKIKELLLWRQAVSKLPSEVQDFFMLLLLSVVESVSLTSKDGQFLRLIKRETPSIKTVFSKKYSQAYNDLLSIKTFQHGALLPDALVFPCDARKLSELPFPKAPTAIITSPPYLNRYDYSRSYVLELCLNFIRDAEHLKEIRHSLLRSHIESKRNGDKPPHEAVAEILDLLSTKSMNNPKIPDMILGYFADMNEVICQLSKTLAENAKVAVVVGNVRFEGIIIPVDMILSDMAQRLGFYVEKIVVTRYKGNSSQQMGKYGREKVRESILIWSFRGKSNKK